MHTFGRRTTKAKTMHSVARCVATGVVAMAALSGCKGRSREEAEGDASDDASGSITTTIARSDTKGANKGAIESTGHAVAAKPSEPEDRRVGPRFKVPGEPELVPSRAERLLAKNQKARVRSAALKRLGRNLSASEVNALCAFLNRKNSQESMSPDRLNALKDSVANKLERQQRPISRY